MRPAFNLMRGKEMGNMLLAALMISTFGVFGVECGSANAPQPQVREQSRETRSEESPATSTVVLTEKQPRSSSEVNVDRLASDTEVLEVAITKVVNPGMTPVEIYVSLFIAETDKSRSSTKLIGNFSLYPPDQPGSFLLNAAPALRQISSAAKDSKREVRLVFEMKRVDETRPWTPIELQVAQPKWTAARK